MHFSCKSNEGCQQSTFRTHKQFEITVHLFLVHLQHSQRVDALVVAVLPVLSQDPRVLFATCNEYLIRVLVAREFLCFFALTRLC